MPARTKPEEDFSQTFTATFPNGNSYILPGIDDFDGGLLEDLSDVPQIKQLPFVLRNLFGDDSQIVKDYRSAKLRDLNKIFDGWLNNKDVSSGE